MSVYKPRFDLRLSSELLQKWLDDYREFISLFNRHHGRSYVDDFYQDSKPATQSATVAGRGLAGSTFASEWIAHKDGEVKSIAIVSASAVTAGSATAQLSINGIAVPGATVSITAGLRAAVTFDRTRFIYLEGDRLGVLLSSSGLTAGSNHLRAILEVLD